ncbi:unnamed protein product [Lymnaea stagnalis]|uniref:Uncharacterized protein n=1 Tax=Lymnaea stagnalis TaxID=6523 RepID=A0AAV2HT70_LYMST
MAVEYLLQNEGLVKMVAVALITLVMVYILRTALQFLVKFKFFQGLPGETSYSLLLGNLHKLPKTGEGRLAYGRFNMDSRNSRFARFWLGPFRPSVVVYHPETVKLVYKSSAPKARGFGSTYEHVIPWIGEGLISSNGAIWARSRRLLTPAFHFDILKQYMDIYNKAADTLLDKLDQYAESGESFDIGPLVTLCTLEVILKCAMSYEADVQRSGQHPYAQAARDLAAAWAIRARTPWMWPSFIFKLTPLGLQFYKNCDYVHKVAEDVIDKRKQQLEKEGLPKKRRLDFLDILLTARDEDGKPMTDLEIRNEVDTFMFAGHDTTAAAIPWLLYCFAKNPEYQVKVQEEIDSVLEGRDSDNIEWSDLSKLETMGLCVKESMRLFPPVPFIQRTMNEDIVLEGHKIPAGTNVTVAIIHLHKNPQVWEEPEKFLPERFKHDNMKDKDSFSFTPFSAGSRNCIGQNFALNEEKVIMSRILRRYNVTLAPDAPKVARVPEAVLKCANGLWFRLEKR